MSAPRLFTRRLSPQSLDPAEGFSDAAETPLRFLDVVSDTESGRVFHFLSRGTTRQVIRKHLPGPWLSQAMIHGAPVLVSDRTTAGLTAEPAEPDLLAGLNVAIATRNGEAAAIIAGWLIHHYRHFAMQGAVMFERAPEDEAGNPWPEVMAALADAAAPMRLVVVHAGIPLGHADMPPESHPWCVTEAPGRDRMTLPPPDPWRAPLQETAICEIARRRFLARARAVAHLDLHDLLQPSKRGTPFDMAADNPGLVIELSGQHCYPWRVRRDDTPSHGDHSCVQFDRPRFVRRWCTVPAGLPESARFAISRIAGAPSIPGGEFFRCMAVRHPSNRAGQIVPKSSLIESAPLVSLVTQSLAADPLRPPAPERIAPAATGPGRTVILAPMRNEGPFILEWLAYHRAIGVDDFLIYTNDCTDGTDDLLRLLDRRGLVQHRDNPFREMGLKPHHGALQSATSEPVIRDAGWIISMDADEFINIKVGEGRLADLYAATDGANMISCTWRLFGNSDIDEFRDESTIDTFTACAEAFCPRPHQAWGFKTLFRNLGMFRKLGVHRPKGLNQQFLDQIRWVNGSGEPLPAREYRTAWRSTTGTFGYDLVSLNHYAVRNAESFLVKRDRGRANHADRDQGLHYWFRMNNNATRDHSIRRHVPKMAQELSALLSDPEIAAQHARCVAAHRLRIEELKADPRQSAFYRQLTDPRMKRLSRMHRHFANDVFLAGPCAVPDAIITDDHPEDFIFSLGSSTAAE